MAEFFAFLFLIGLIITCVFMAKPSLSQFNNRPALTRKKIALYGFGTCLVLFVLIGIFAPKLPTPTTAVVENKQNETAIVEPKGEKVAEIQPEEVPVKLEANLGMTPEQFRKAFNDQLKKHDISFIRTLGEFDIKKGDVRDSFLVQFSDDLGMTGVVNKDGMLREVLFIMTNSNEMENPVPNLFIVTGTTSNILNSNNKKDATDSLVDLIKKSMEGINNENNTHSKFIGNIKYYALASPELGLWVGFSPKDEK